MMTSEQLRDLAVAALDDMKGVDIVTMDVRTLTSIADFMIVCTGRSSRQVKGLANSVVTKAKEAGHDYVRIEGDGDSEWVLVDLGDVIVHTMLASAREFYSLEDLWEPIKEMRDDKNAK